MASKLGDNKNSENHHQARLQLAALTIQSTATIKVLKETGDLVATVMDAQIQLDEMGQYIPGRQKEESTDEENSNTRTERSNPRKDTNQGQQMITHEKQARE